MQTESSAPQINLAAALAGIVTALTLLFSLVTWTSYGNNVPVLGVSQEARLMSQIEGRPAAASSKTTTIADRSSTALPEDGSISARPGSKSITATTTVSATVTTTVTRDCTGIEPIEVIGIYVINMNTQKERYWGFRNHVASLCGVQMKKVFRHPGAIAAGDARTLSWMREFVPAVNLSATRRWGTLGLALAHLSLWAKIHHSRGCKGHGTANRYAVIFEDDERPKDVFPDAIKQLLSFFRRLPDKDKPDFVNLNAKRAFGQDLATLDLPKPTKLLRVAKQTREGRTGPLNPHDLRYNVWLSAYMVRCGSLATMVYHGGRYPGGSRPYDGVHPVFDWQMSDIITDKRIPIRGFVVPRNGISQHLEGFDSRKSMDQANRTR